MVVPRESAAALIERVRESWRAALVAEAGDSALADIDRLQGALVDLTAAHPSGVAQLFAGRTTPLSNLVREGSALAVAKRRARAVASRAEDHAHRFGLASGYLAIGVASWSEEPTDDAAADRASHTVRAPALLRPVNIRPRRGDTDHDLLLEPSLEVNPVLASALRARGALLDPAALARDTFAPTGFDPRPGLERLRALGATLLADFQLDERLLVGTFVHPEQSLVDDLDTLADSLPDHEVLTALAGDRRSIDALAHPLPPMLRGDRPPEEERGVGDLDPVQVHVLDVLAAGHHLLVDAPPGSDVAGTAAAAIADAVAGGRTVLYVAGHRRSAEALTERLAGLGLGEAVMDVMPGSGWREQAGQRLLGAMTVDPVSIDNGQVETVERELAARRGRLQRYLVTLHTQRAPWGASAYDALQALARLTAGRPVPQTKVRLPIPVAELLDTERRQAAASDLTRAATLGAFSAATRSSAWYGADLATPELALGAISLVETLQEGLPGLHTEADRVAAESGINPPLGPAQWAEQLEMLAGVRAALDVFRPVVFERSAADMIAATATRAWREERGIVMRRSLRRRLRRQARDLLRPGRPVADLNGALIDVHSQREKWREHCPDGAWPRVPGGLAVIEAQHRHVRGDLDALSALLTGTPDLAELSWDDLEARLHRLLKDRTSLETLPERTELLLALEERGLGELLGDLSSRHVGADVVTAELDLAWWSTAFEEILRQDPTITSHDGWVLTRLVAEFRVLDQRFLADRGALARVATGAAVQSRMHSADTQTQELFGEIVEGRFSTLRSAIERYPDVARHLRPCIVASPMHVPHLLPATRTQDLVILDAAAHLPVELVVSALARGKQVLVIGDTRCAPGSALAALAAVLPSVSLQADASRRDPHLTAFLAEHGYGDQLVPWPLPVEADLLRLELVEGTGMPAENGLVEGAPAEVERVVGLINDHVRDHPEESLAVITASAVHAERVREALLALMPRSPALEAFCDHDRPEPFTVVELGATQSLSRDAIILSVGFGRTPHGRVLHRFGALSEPDGDARLLAALGSPRHRLTVVSCFSAEHLDRDRLNSPGPVLLADLLTLVADRSAATDSPERAAPTAGTDPDRLVLDLAERLWRMGLLVDVGHGIPGGARIPLVVGHPDLPGQMLVAVLTDDAAYVSEPSIRVRDRQLPQRLERLGWTVVQVWSAAAFLDPQAEAQAICAAVVDARSRRTSAGSAPPVATAKSASRSAEPLLPSSRPDDVDAHELPDDDARLRREVPPHW